MWSAVLQSLAKPIWYLLPSLFFSMKETSLWFKMLQNNLVHNSHQMHPICTLYAPYMLYKPGHITRHPYAIETLTERQTQVCRTGSKWFTSRPRKRPRLRASGPQLTYGPGTRIAYGPEARNLHTGPVPVLHTGLRPEISIYAWYSRINNGISLLQGSVLILYIVNNNCLQFLVATYIFNARSTFKLVKLLF